MSGLDDLWFHGARWIHIAAGAFAALVLFPLQFLAAPGGPRHRARRRIVTIAVWVIAIAGAAMLVNPEFSGFWTTDSTDLGIVDWDTGFTWTRPFVGVGVLLVVIVVWDLSTWRPGFRPRTHTWQHHHTTRLVVAWGGLFYAVELRARIRFDAMAPWSHRIDLAWVLLVAVAVVAANARFRRDARRTPTAPLAVDQ